MFLIADGMKDCILLAHKCSNCCTNRPAKHYVTHHFSVLGKSWWFDQWVYKPLGLTYTTDFGSDAMTSVYCQFWTRYFTYKQFSSQITLYKREMIISIYLYSQYDAKLCRYNYIVLLCPRIYLKPLLKLKPTVIRRMPKFNSHISARPWDYRIAFPLDDEYRISFSCVNTQQSMLCEESYKPTARNHK